MGNPIFDNFICGGSAGAVATAITFPFDVLRTRFASQGHKKVTQYINLQDDI